MPNADLTPYLRDRWSPRVFDPTHELTTAQLELILEAARWAPSAGNTQRWAFLAGLRGDPTFTEFQRYLSRGNAGWVANVSAVVVICFQTGAAPEDQETPYLDLAEYDAGQTAAHMTVQAASMGLHAHQFAGFDHQGVADAFGVPDHWRVATGIAIGRIGDPATSDVHEKDRSGRKPLSEIAYAGSWGAPLV
ncbi:nitroreductase family protein [Nocardioides jiangxiensis]|uniref:Nitroreductase family protein n=1 Tax=Nocardioides jiangxiensis TaxID=3064524 RepID=A0ABT9B0P3_9ACTN|nr:nitroreductase family protein [Nocardioides sp. WY-20]MDO7868282.1 nitroreductase family protein [Nocardioides sp. WY-20]